MCTDCGGFGSLFGITNVQTFNYYQGGSRQDSLIVRIMVGPISFRHVHTLGSDEELALLQIAILWLVELSRAGIHDILTPRNLLCFC